jgi:hypothetical protein
MGTEKREESVIVSEGEYVNVSPYIAAITGLSETEMQVVTKVDEDGYVLLEESGEFLIRIEEVTPTGVFAVAKEDEEPEMATSRFYDSIDWMTMLIDERQNEIDIEKKESVSEWNSKQLDEATAAYDKAMDEISIVNLAIEKFEEVSIPETIAKIRGHEYVQ